jgi:hypothetical protein
MKRFTGSAIVSGALLLAFSGIYASPAAAQATRTWVSGVGDDVNPCSRTAPCKTFAGAISKTAAGGEIDCLDPGGFGTVTITKSITIDCRGTFGSILASGTNGVNVNDSASGFPNTIRVVLRGLSINGAGGGAQNAQGNLGTGLIGVNFTSGASLVIEDVLIQNFDTSTAAGVAFRPAGTARMSVSNSVITGNGTGVLVQPTGPSGNARVTLNNLELNNNSTNGVRVDSTGATSGLGLLVDIQNSRIANSTNGLAVNTPIGTTFARANILGSTLVHNSNGLIATGANALIRASGNMITDNGFGISFSGGGQIFGYGDNVTDGNQNPATFSPGSPLGKN